MKRAAADTAGTDSVPRLRSALEEAGLRHTAQRAAVYEALDATRSHPTADELFSAVRRRLPDISLATVYKALEAFASVGLCRKLTHGEGPARYDARTDRHHHLRCEDCGRVVDVEGGPDPEWMRGVRAPAGFRVHDVRVVLVGRCGDCDGDAAAA